MENNNLCQNKILIEPLNQLEKPIEKHNDNSITTILNQKEKRDEIMQRSAEKERRHKYYISNIKKWKTQYRQQDKDIIKTRSKKYRESHKTEIAVRDKEYRIKNSDKVKKGKREWQRINKSKINLRNKIRKQTDINYKLACNLRNRLNRAIKNNWKNGSAVKDLGCSIEDFKKYIESKFQEGMTWDNYGLNTWHIDHITPLSWFNLEDRNQFLVACHYTNQQPLWARDNWEKPKQLT